MPLIQRLKSAFPRKKDAAPTDPAPETSSTEGFTLNALAKVIGSTPPVIDGDVLVTSLSTDTRTLTAGAVYLALKGENFDGHNYLAQAKEQGAIAVIAERDEPLTIPVLVVSSTTKALGDIALLTRQQFTGPVVGVTGSIGKTTTKELIALILETMFTVTKSEANHNNQIGLPQTILGTPETATAWVLEMGMRGAGQIAELARIAQPTIGVITGIGLSHIELLGSRQGIANAKAELFEALPAEVLVETDLDSRLPVTGQVVGGAEPRRDVLPEGERRFR